MRSSPGSFLAVAAAAVLAGTVHAQNDDCTGAIVVAQGLNGPYSNVGATLSSQWPCVTAGADVWFLYVAPGTGSLTATTCNNAIFDTALEILDGAAGCGSLVSLGCNDDACGVQSSVTTNVAAGGTYYIRVGGYFGDAGTFSLDVNGPSGSGTIALNTSIGAGCIAQFASFYEYFATSAAFDLSNSGISMLPTGSGYLALPAIVAYVPPSASATVLNLFDDDEIAVTLASPFVYPGGSTTSLTVCSNGFVSVGAGNGTDYVPDVGLMLDAPQTAWWNWHDYDPSDPSGGEVKFEQVGGVAYVTWDGVYDYDFPTGPANANTFQFQFDTSSGLVHLVFQTISALGNERLVGYSPGGASVDPGGIDISTALPNAITVHTTDVLPLALSGVTRPVVGTSWTLAVGNIPTTATIGVDVFGLSDPNIPDLSFLGAPGCGLRSSLDFLLAWIASGPTHTRSLALPNDPAIVGMHVFATAAVFQSPAPNTFGAITANGIDALLGNL